jgi:predicted RNA polymerase sigma factor
MADAIARRSYGKLVAFLAASTRDVAAAEDALADAFAAALAEWPGSGCPVRPEAWLVTVARRKFIDEVRRHRASQIAANQLQLIAEGLESAAASGEIPDRRLALLFATAHPAVDPGISAPFMLQTALGFDARMIASAFLSSPEAMAKRLVRAKNKIKQAGIPFGVPKRDELPGRLDAVLSAIYAVFAEGWADPAGKPPSAASACGRGKSLVFRSWMKVPALTPR